MIVCLKKEKIIVNTINQYSYCIAEEDPEFKLVLMESDVLLPDGIGVVLGAKFIHGSQLTKIAGADIHHFFLEKLNRESGSCFYLCSSEITLSKITERIVVEYPNITLETYSPPFKPDFTEEDNLKMITMVNNFQPDVLFIGMTAPKQ